MCGRCGKDEPTKRGKWCKACEHEYDGWVRRHATDIVWVVLGGGVILGTAGVLLPLVGFETFAAAIGVFLGWGTILTASRLNSRRRRRQFLEAPLLPRAYLPAPK